MSRRSCLLRDKIVRQCIVPKPEKKQLACQRWSISKSVAEAAGNICPKNAGPRFKKSFARAQFLATEMVAHWRSVIR